MHKRFLKVCESLRDKKLYPVFELGAVISRGFADLGYEEFVITGEHAIVSLYTGKPGQCPEEHRHFFFRVPDTELLASTLYQAGWGIKCAERADGRVWRVEIMNEEGMSEVSEERSLNLALAELLLRVT